MSSGAASAQSVRWVRRGEGRTVAVGSRARTPARAWNRPGGEQSCHLRRSKPAAEGEEPKGGWGSWLGKDETRYQARRGVSSGLQRGETMALAAESRYGRIRKLLFQVRQEPRQRATARLLMPAMSSSGACVAWRRDFCQRLTRKAERITRIVPRTTARDLTRISRTVILRDSTVGQPDVFLCCQVPTNYLRNLVRPRRHAHPRAGPPEALPGRSLLSLRMAGRASDCVSSRHRPEAPDTQWSLQTYEGLGAARVPPASLSCSARRLRRPPPLSSLRFVCSASRKTTYSDFC